LPGAFAGSGFSGFSGISGWSGISGISGFSGFSGSGISGFSGFSGFSGISGFSGFSGSGISGFSGWSGISGFSGYSAVSGFSGYSGTSGFSGLNNLTARTTSSATTGSINNNISADLNITGFKGYALYAVATNVAARVIIYTNASARTADASRAEGVDPSSTSGVISEVITTGNQTVYIIPALIGFNLESPTTTNIPVAVTNKSGGATAVTVTLTLVQLEA
jgi:hypothetical protein